MTELRWPGVVATTVLLRRRLLSLAGEKGVPCIFSDRAFGRSVYLWVCRGIDFAIFV